MSRCLIGLDQLGGNPITIGHQLAHRRLGGFQNRFDRGNCRSGQFQQVGQNYWCRCHCRVLSIMSHESPPFRVGCSYHFALAAQQKYVSLSAKVQLLRKLICSAAREGMICAAHERSSFSHVAG